LSRNHKSYIPGVRDPNGWEHGRVEPQGAYQNVGSQTPIAHDRDGHPVKVEGRGMMKIPGYEWHDKSPEFHKLAKKIAKKVASKIYPEDAKPGKHYLLQGFPHMFTSKFLGWGVGSSGPRMTWEDVGTGEEWVAYLHEGRMCWGTHAEPLVILSEAQLRSSV